MPGIFAIAPGLLEILHIEFHSFNISFNVSLMKLCPQTRGHVIYSEVFPLKLVIIHSSLNVYQRVIKPKSAEIPARLSCFPWLLRNVLGARQRAVVPQCHPPAMTGPVGLPKETRHSGIPILRPHHQAPENDHLTILGGGFNPFTMVRNIQ